MYFTKFTFLLVGIALFLQGCQSHAEKPHEVGKLLVTTPFAQDTTILKEYVCQIRAIQHIEIRALERGYLQETFVDEGQLVRKGTQMFQIMPALYQAETHKAEAEVNFAKIEYQNTKVLADSNIVSKNELALAKAKLDKANAELELAQAHLNFTKIQAPFDGIMNRLEVRLGSLVEEGELLTTLSDNSKMWVYFNVPEAEYLDYATNGKKGEPLKVRLQMANKKIFDQVGIVETIEADFNNETGNIAFRATFPNPNAILRHGETGNILMPTTLENALLIPQKATFEVLDKKYVYVVDDKNRVQTRLIEVAAELPHLYIVSKGLSVEDKVLIEGLRKVKNNQEIEYNFEEPEKVLTALNALHAE
ncbi:efflux RND transporter periplasmic adaptor subunit [Hugenholtzia roseola]|uniref:efflux RND transporter periplasmic adaptor subunit n=1 Tax=Hugenholtzia roseola TaxID=1002 RepID=UPI0004014A52|nr:efflux RND transporter periplasmic adaptor subunit [Hugenholtzia roseola]